MSRKLKPQMRESAPNRSRQSSARRGRGVAVSRACFRVAAVVAAVLMGTKILAPTS